MFGAAILIVRNPFKAFIAEWTRLQSVKYGISGGANNKHINQVGPDRFRMLITIYCNMNYSITVNY